MHFSTLPTEIILIIAETSDSQSTINALAQANRALYSLLNSFLYRYHVRRYEPAPALTWAAQYGQSRTLQKLLRAGADVYSEALWDAMYGPNESHPINIAASNGCTSIVKILLDEGMSTRLTDLNYNNMLLFAVSANRIDVVKLLLDRGVNPWHTAKDMTIICCAARREHSEIVKLLLQDGEKRDPLSRGIIHQEISRTLMSYAECSGNEDIARMLIASGADVNSIHHGGRFFHDVSTTALDTAAWYRRVSTLKLLLAAGANPNIVNSDRKGPLASAARPDDFPNQDMKGQRTAMVSLLFEYGADPARAGGGGALLSAAGSQNYEMAHLLIDNGTVIKCPELDVLQQASMDQAVEERDFATIRRLTNVIWPLGLICGRLICGRPRRDRPICGRPLPFYVPEEVPVDRFLSTPFSEGTPADPAR
ncbi:hypothetical protein DTO217A2_6827 [Paecilomyces variotii]|nr:hypothetical protein DTO217A2_6827 [Paecilomyces variotii]